MRLLPSFDEALAALQKLKGLTLILGDWDDGLQLVEGLSGEQVTEKINAVRQKYREQFPWRAFNRNTDVCWNGEDASVCEGEPIKENTKKIFLETDYRRFKGIGIFWDECFSEPRYTHAEVEEVHWDSQAVYLRLLGLHKEGKRNGGEA